MRDLTEKQFQSKLAAHGFTASLGRIYFKHPDAPGVLFGAVFNGVYDGETAIDKMPINRRATLAHLLKARTRLRRAVQSLEPTTQQTENSRGEAK
jgi:hypothetical protein